MNNRKLCVLCFIVATLFSTALFSQDLSPFTREVNPKIIQYCIDSLNFPEININIIEEEAKSQFEMELKNWHSQNPGYENLFKDLDFNQYKAILKTIAINNYPPKPQFIDTGNTRQDEIDYKNKLRKWAESHPDYPKYTGVKNDDKNKESLRKARLSFYDKYIKNK